MEEAFLVSHDNLINTVQNIVEKASEVEIFDRKQMYYQVKAAYDYISSETEDKFASAPVVIRGFVSNEVKIEGQHLSVTLILDAVMHLANDGDTLFPMILQEDEVEPNVSVNVVDVIFDSLTTTEEELTVTTDKFVPNVPNADIYAETDLASSYILYNMPEITSQLARSLDFSSLYDAIANMSVAVINAK